MVFRSVRAAKASAKAAETGVSACMERADERIPAAAETGEVISRRGEASRGEANCSGNRGREED